MGNQASPLVGEPTQESKVEQAFLAELAGEAAVPAETPELPEAEEPEGEAPPTDQEQPLFDLPEGWDKHPDAESRINEAYNQAKSTLTRSHAAAVAELEATHQEELARATDRATASTVVQQFAETMGNLDLDDPDSVRTARSLLQSTDAWARVFLGAQERDAQSSLVTQITKDKNWTAGLPEADVDDFNATVAELSLKLRSDVAKASDREEVTTAYSKALGAYLEERDKRRDKVIAANAVAAEKARLEGIARKAAGLTERGAPPARPPGGGAGSPTLRTPPDHDLDAMFAEEARRLAALKKGKK